MSENSPAPSPIMPPNDVEAEGALLGAALIDPGIVPFVTGCVSPEDMYAEAHKRILRAMITLARENAPIDFVTTCSQLRGEGQLATVGGMPYMHDLLNCPGVVKLENVKQYAKVVAERAQVRRLLFAVQKIQAECYVNFAVPGFVQKCADIVNAIAAEKQTTGIRSNKDVMHDLVRRAITRHEQGSELSGLATGLLNLDGVLDGLQRQQLTILAARPSMGKTTLACAIGEHVAKSGTPTLVFSMEQSEDELAIRYASAKTGIDSKKLRLGQLSPAEWAKYQEACIDYAELPMHVDARPGLTMGEIRQRIMEHIRPTDGTSGIGLVIIDYLQIIKSASTRKNETEEQQISENAQALKAIAREFNIHVICLAQNNRQGEQRVGVDKRPKLSDLKGSGGIEANADIVIFMHRPNYNQYETTNEDGPQVTELLVAKNRNGARSRVVTINFEARFTRFTDRPQEEGAA